MMRVRGRLVAGAAVGVVWLLALLGLAQVWDAQTRAAALEHRLAVREGQLGDLMDPRGLTRVFESSFGQRLRTPGFNATRFHNELSLRDDALVRELVARRSSRYWLESKETWPKMPIPPTDKYVTFSPWRGGFNNIRMSLEMAVAFAVASQRTLVLPPKYKMYLRGESSLMSYFDFEDLRRGLPVITYEEFFDRIDFGQFQKERPSDTSLHSGTERYYAGLKEMPGVYISKEKWRANQIGGQVVYCVPNCPHSPGKDASTEERAEYDWFKEFSRKLTSFDLDDPEIQQARVVHFPENLLGHFYTFVWFRDPQLGRHVKRVIRDHVHFREEILENAERIITLLGDFKFSCLHIRRNEFQFKDVWTPAETIVENTKRLFKKGETIYISTDELSDEKERKKKWSDPTAMVKVVKHTWFEPMKREFGKDKVVFLSDFFDEVLGPETRDIWIGCIETLVCSRARVFVGTRKSTFSGYINRLRGYMHDVGQKLILEAQSKYPRDYFRYFKGPEWNHLSGAYGGGHPYWGREYKEGWEWVYDPLG